MVEERTPLILLVDDVPRNLQLLCSILAPKGYQLSPVTGAEQALKIIEKSPPDLILLDVMMPGVDGFTFCRRLKEDDRYRDIPVIFITARKEAEDISAGFAAGGVDYISKPFNSGELLARVSTHLQIKKLRDQLEQKNTVLEQQNRRFIDELDLARKLQRTLLPAAFPHNCGLQFYSSFVPSERLSGDLFHVERLDNKKTAWFVADVSSHGVSSAMVTFFVREAIQSVHSEGGGFSPAGLLERINRRMVRLHLQTDDNIWYFTLFYAVFDSSTGMVEYSCAGHEPAYLVKTKQQKIKKLSYPSLPIGWFENAEYENRRCSLDREDSVLLSSDGLLEQMHNGEQFGERRLFDVLDGYVERSGRMDELVPEALIQAVKSFSEREELADDVTVVLAVYR